METISGFMMAEHRRCDELLGGVEDRISAGEWDGAQSEFSGFKQAMEQHFTMEESVMFPSFEARTGSSAGPTQVMRMEHEQVHSLLADMVNAIGAKDQDASLGVSETLLIIIQQHNSKEEQILYPMVDRMLGNEAQEIIARMQATVNG
ncbi:MAG: hemerythrin domain-containing protein [Gammaproteobacteria bacterium]|nr:hemerythrin domain-containing protein [Gammaproteobacteria bacterium]